MKDRRTTLAVILILFGIIIFVGNFVPIFQMRLIWPVIIIIIGLGIMFRDLC